MNTKKELQAIGELILGIVMILGAGLACCTCGLLTMFALKSVCALLGLRWE